ncbi:MAG TPA: hypothetical protein VG708_16055 [Mycobacteriales bacterium]|nr:hypothetical protein [Mycobacteriales bacterium]
MARPHGADAAVYREHGGTITFWYRHHNHWRVVASKAFPAFPASFHSGPLQVHGYLPAGAPHALFLVTGALSFDGYYQAVGYATGRHGWGVLTQTSAHRLTSSGHGSTYKGRQGERHWMSLSGGRLTIDDIHPFFSVADGSYYPHTTTWVWRHRGFDVASDNQFVAATSTPATAILGVAAGCPDPATTGTYAAYVDGFRPQRQSPRNGLSTVRLVFAPTAHDVVAGTSNACTVRLPRDQPITVQATTGHGPTWITAPSWMMLQEGNIFYAGQPLPIVNGYPFGDIPPHEAPYRVPARLGVTAITSDFGVTLPKLQGAPGAASPRAVPANLTFTNGALTSLTLTATVPTSPSTQS